MKDSDESKDERGKPDTADYCWSGADDTFIVVTNPKSAADDSEDAEGSEEYPAVQALPAVFEEGVYGGDNQNGVDSNFSDCELF